MVGFPTENASGFAEHLNKEFRLRELGRYRVLCLSRVRSNVLMWGHYANSYNGLVVGIDTDVPEFQPGIRRAGYEIVYAADRSRTRLPLAFYRSPGVESYDLLTRRIVNNPNQLVESDSGILIPFREYRRQVEEATITALTTKAEDWRYESEVRFIYELNSVSSGLVSSNGLSLVAIPPSAVREIVVGFRVASSLVKELVRLHGAGAFGNARLAYAECHPYKYEVEANFVDSDYLVQYFDIVLPSFEE